MRITKASSPVVNAPAGSSHIAVVAARILDCSIQYINLFVFFSFILLKLSRRKYYKGIKIKTGSGWLAGGRPIIPPSYGDLSSTDVSPMGRYFSRETLSQWRDGADLDQDLYLESYHYLHIEQFDTSCDARKQIIV